MRKRWIAALVALLLLGGGILFVCLRPPAPEPRYPMLEKGMTWDRAEEILGKKPYGTFLKNGNLEKWYTDVDGRVRITLDGEVVTEVEYIPDVPDPTIFYRVAKWLRL